jgi:hypothetical protein
MGAPGQPYTVWTANQPPLYEASAEAPQNLPYTLEWKDLRILASASLQAEWNDNISLVNQHPLGDYILSPMVNLQGLLPITGENTLNLTLGCGYAAYLIHPVDSHLLITPGSSLDFKARAGDYLLDLHDCFNYVEDASLYGNISGLAELGGFFNTAGLDVVREFGPVRVTLGYDHKTFLASSSDFTPLDNNSDTGTARVSIAAAAGLLTGIEAAGGTTYFGPGQELNLGGVHTLDVLSRYENYSAGPFAGWQIASRLNALFKAGFMEHLYDDPALTQNHSSIPGYYVSAQFQGKVNDKLNLHLEGGREEIASIDGSLVQQWYGSAGGSWEIIRNGILTASVRYENAHVPFETSFDNYVEFTHDFDRVLFQAGFTYPLARRLAAGITYKLILKESATELAQYALNDVALGLNWTF